MVETIVATLIQITHRFSGKILFEGQFGSLKLAVEAAVGKGANLKGANLKGANLKGANLEGAYLEGADLKGADLKGAYLEGANLKGANLEGANLKGADLKGAYLKGADLEGAYLKGANLKGANLEGADLEGANLKGANLKGANLKGAYLTPIRDDLWAVLSSRPSEVEGLRAALVAGKVDGTTYSGACACLVGTIANLCNKDINELGLLKPQSNRPIERFFLSIKPGDTPDKSQVSKIVVGWIDGWLLGVKAAFGAKS